MVSILGYSHLPKNPTKFLSGDRLQKDWVESELTFIDHGLDTLYGQEVYLLYNDSGIPQIYYADVLADVCIDGLCKPLFIELYWDLLGQYSGFGVYPDELLSKFDHDLFTEQDYEKLDRLLADPYSKLEGKKLTDLYDPSKKREKVIEFKGKEVDGISGATKKEIKETVVEGALYSCFTLWQLANGEISVRIKENLSGIYTPALAQDFMESGISDYQVYAIKQFDDQDFTRYLKEVTMVILQARPLDRAWILKELPLEIWKNTTFVDSIYSNYAGFDSNTKTLLVNKLSLSTEKAALYLSSNLKEMTKNQIKTFLDSLSEITPEIMENLVAFSEDEQNIYGYLGIWWMMEYKRR